jgi:cell shape-determining protein MreC
LLAGRKFSEIPSIFGISESVNSVLRPWQLVVMILAGWVNRRQQEIIEFQNAQIQALMNKLGRKRILLTDDQRRVLAVKGKALGRKTSRS